VLCRLRHGPSADEKQLNDDVPTPEPPRDDLTAAEHGLRLRDDVIIALRLFSRLPTGQSPHLAPDLSRVALGLPFASLVIGLGPALLLMLALLIGLPPLFAAALAIGSQLLITGAMSEDGLADAADGLFGGASIERRLEIMRDSRHGTYGVGALWLFLALKTVALSTIAAANPLEAAALWIAAATLARSLGLWTALALPPARRDGVSAAAGRPRMRSFLIGLVFALGFAFLLAGPAVGIIAFVLMVVAGAAAVLGWTGLCRRLVGGQTGDLVGAGQGLGEIAAFAALLLFF
jgi:adenosylcobinamide-GDP ribazoletransferase